MNTTITPQDLLAHSAWLQRLARRLVDSATAEDLVQETWASALRARPDRERPLRPWLAEVLRNLVRMRARGSQRWQSRASQVAAAADVALPTPEELLGFHEAQRLVASAVAELDEPYRSTVLLCYAQDIEPSEIARRQGIPAGTVRWRLKRGLDRLRSRLDEQCGGDRRNWALALAPLARMGLPAPAGVFGSSGGAALGMTALLAVARTKKWQVATSVAALGVAGIVAWVMVDRAGMQSDTGSVASARQSRHSTLGSSPFAGMASAKAVPRLTVGPGGGPAAPGPGGGAPAAPGLGAPVEDVALARKRAAEVGDSPTRGPVDAPVTVVIWSDFQCPFCARAVATLKQIEVAYPKDVRFVWKHLPLPFHESAQLAAEASLAAQEQGKFWEMHDRLFAHQDQIDPQGLEQHAKAIDLDMARFKASFDGGKFRKRVESDAALAKQAKIVGAPTFLINGDMLSGAQPLPAFQQKIEVALAVAKGLPVPAPPAVSAPRSGPPNGQLAARAGSPFWPPLKVTLPDDLLGERIKARFSTGDAPMRGNPKGPVEVLYFTALGRMQARVAAEGLLSAYGEHVRLIAKILPPESLATLDDKKGDSRAEAQRALAPLAAEAARYADDQGKFWEFHDAFAGDGFSVPDRATITKTAEKIGLDAAALAMALDDGRYRAQVTEDFAVMKAAGINGHAFVVDGRRAQGTVALVQLVESAMRKAGRRPPPRAGNSWAPPMDPKDPRYNVQMLLAHLSPAQLFALEPRDDAWASAVEKELGPLVTRDLRAIDPKADGARVECHSTLCRLRVQPGKAVIKPLLAAADYLYGGMRQPPADLLLTLRNNATVTAPDLLVKVKSKRNTVLYNQRTGRGRAGLAFPVDRLPKE